jgi:hypothetical protein
MRAPEAERERWLLSRREYIRTSRYHDRELWSVPLLATLVVLLLGDQPPEKMPRSRAQLLVEVVRSSVRRWEARRADFKVPGVERDLTAEMLFDCYADIAHVVLSESGEWKRAESAVRDRLRENWNLPEEIARAAAEVILDHWDSKAGVFVTSEPGGRLNARIRLFAEIGEAMWFSREENDSAAWMAMAIPEADRRESARLAAGLSVKAAEALARLAIQQGNDLLDLVLDALSDGADPGQALISEVTEMQLRRVERLSVELRWRSGVVEPPPRPGVFRVPTVLPAASLAVRLACTALKLRIFMWLWVDLM